MTVALYQPTPSMDRTPRGWAWGATPIPEGAKLLGVFATAAEAQAMRDVAAYIYDQHEATVAAALLAYKAADGPAHVARRAMETAARDIYLATTDPARKAWMEAAEVQRQAALAVLPRLG